METRPKPELVLSPLDKSLEMAGIISFFLMWVITIYAFVQLPDIIPTHFNATGKPDSYGDKKTLFILPVIASIIYMGMTHLNKYPHIFNYLTKITADNAQKQYTLATRMLRFVKLAILVLFSIIILFTYLTATGITDGLNTWMLPLAIIIMLLPLIRYIIKSLREERK